MDDYIKREDAYSACCYETPDCYMARKEIKALPSADVAPVRHAHWEVIDAEEPRRYGCSECKRLSWHMENYCPNCGAKMDGDNNAFI